MPAYDTQDEAEYFYNDLAPYGQWIQVTEYGPCWQPYGYPPDWRPYTLGHWEYTDDAGWLWLSDEPFGWCCYHYGRWAFVASFGWCWVPGREWSAAWVEWRYGGGYVGWAPLPPAGFGISIGVQIGEPPDWAFCFVEERYMTDVHIRERIEPVTRNVTLINITKNVTKFEVVNGRVINRGVDVNVIEKATGIRVARRRLADVADPRSIGLRENRVNVYRPRLLTRPAARPQQPRFSQSPTRMQTPAELEARYRQVAEYHQRLVADMVQRHQRELQSPPPGWTRERLLAQQALEREAFEEQRQRELAAVQFRPPVLHRIPAAERARDAR